MGANGLLAFLWDKMYTIAKLWLLVTKKLLNSLNLTFRYTCIDDVLSLKNSKFSKNIDLIYPHELDIEETTDSVNSNSYVDLQLKYNNQVNYTHI